MRFKKITFHRDYNTSWKTLHRNYKSLQAEETTDNNLRPVVSSFPIQEEQQEKRKEHIHTIWIDHTVLENKLETKEKNDFVFS